MRDQYKGLGGFRLEQPLRKGPDEAVESISATGINPIAWIRNFLTRNLEPNEPIS